MNTPTGTFREKLAKLAVITITTEPETEPVRGNASAIDPVTDKETEDWIFSELESGNEWAWCMVRVRATLGAFHANQYLGACSYKSEADFKTGGYFEDMVNEALDDLCCRTLVPFTLFNGTHEYEAPDWTLFDGVEVSPVARNEHGDGTTHCEVIHDERTPDMWSVYGHFDHRDPRNANQGGVECLTDCDSELLAGTIGILFTHLIREAKRT